VENNCSFVYIFVLEHRGPTKSRSPEILTN
jgi:hypothetical protein